MPYQQTQQRNLTYINVKDYGAQGNGTTDDYASIAAAIAACSSGGTVFLPPAIYRISQAITLPPNITLLSTHGNRAILSTAILAQATIKPLASFSGAAAILMVDQQQGGYNGDNGGQRLKNITLDGSALSGTVDGIQASGLVHDVMLENVAIDSFPHNGITTTSYTRLDSSQVHPYSWTFINCIAYQCANIGFSFNGMTDTELISVEALGNGLYGFFLATMANSHFISCRAEFSGSYGFYITGGWGTTPAGSGGATFSGCSTDRNNFDGVHIDATGNGSLLFAGLMCRRDGKNGGSGGGGYAGLNASNSTMPIIIESMTCYPGQDDNGAGTVSPDYGATFSGNTWIDVVSGYFHAIVAGYHDGGSNTVLRRGLNVGEATGSTSSPTRTASTPWNTNGTGTISLASADQAALSVSNTQANTGLALFDITGSANTTRMLDGQVSGDTNRRFDLRVDGTMAWGAGNAPRDTNLYRNSAGVLKTDNSFTVGTNLAVTGTTILTGEVTVPSPTNGTDASTKTYVDAGLAAKQAIVKTGLAKISGGATQWGAPNTTFFNVGTSSLNVNEVRYITMRVEYAVTLTAWQLEVTTGPATNANIRIGVYVADTNIQPTGAPLYDSGSVAVASSFTGIKTASSLSISLAPGVYLVCLNTDTAMTVRTFTSGSPIIGAALGTTPMIQRVAASQTYGAFPNPGTVWTSTNASASGLQNFAVWQWSE